MINIEDMFQLDDCIDWIVKNKFKKIALQLKPKDLKYSVDIVDYLKSKSLEKFSCDLANTSNESLAYLDIYVAKANTCCIDLLVTQHVTNLDAIIHFGKVCLSKPEIKNFETKQQILFVFGKVSVEDGEKFQEKSQLILTQIEHIKTSDTGCRICLLYDSSLIDYANHLSDKIEEKCLTEYVDIANLHCPDSNWFTTPNNQPRFIKSQDAENLFGHFSLKHPIKHYNYAIYLGDNLSINLALNCPPKLLKFNCFSSVMEMEEVNLYRLLNKRISLVERLKEEEDLKIGVIITNPLPDLTTMMDRLEKYSKPRKHTLYFISMIQTIDECKIGNFDLCDAFIVINSCTCSTILESLVFNRPILTELEFKLACGLEAEYGRVLWPGSSSHLSTDDMINKRKVSDVTLALIQTRNELLERCSQARANKWSGLEYSKATAGSSGICDAGHSEYGDNRMTESLALEEGLKGIASSYLSEPLKKEIPVLEEGKATSNSANTYTTTITNDVATDGSGAGSVALNEDRTN